MAKSPELTDQRLSVATLILSATALIIASFAILPAKAPWVDELYTWYGIRHETFEHFADSISSGINFSPPLYFFLNWLVQLVTPLSLDALRVESLLWVLGGGFLVHRAASPNAGDLASACGVAVVLLQSTLLREQSLEARQYGMMFFCGAAVAFSGNQLAEIPTDRKRQVYHALAHLALCLTHYLGIVFSGTASLALVLARWKKEDKLCFPRVEMFAWVPSITLYLILLARQSSHLGTWPRPNAPADLAALHLDSFLPLSIALPFLAFLLISPTAPTKATPKTICKASRHSHLPFLAIFWILIPSLIWIISNITPLNLFKERYFMPKESAYMFALALLFAKFDLQKTPKNNINLIISYALLLIFCITSLVLYTQRKLFALEPSRNYYHWLIADEAIQSSHLPKVFTGDPIFFPNLYLSPPKTDSYLLLPEPETARVYQDFSSRTNILTPFDLKKFSEYLLITDKEIPDSQLLPSLSPHGILRAYQMRDSNP